VPSLPEKLRDARDTWAVLSRSGLLRPDHVLAAVRGYRRWGPTASAGFAASARRRGAAVAVTDDRGELPFAELDARTHAIARGLAAAGVREGDGVGILCRNHRGFVEAVLGAEKAGAGAVFLNPGFAAPQLAGVAEREGLGALVFDEEFLPVVDAAASRGASFARRFLARTQAEPGDGGPPTLDRLARTHSREAPPKPAKPTGPIILTSGTTGTPKGARRPPKTTGLETTRGLLEAIPYRTDERFHIAAPLFHAWGLAQLLVASAFSATTVLRPRFDPEGTLAAVAESRAQVLVVVPVMLQRILALGPEVRARYDTSSLRMVLSSGSALPGELANRWMDAFGDTLYNFYGSTEVAQASIATPDDLRRAPGTAGRVPRGAVVRIVDADGKEVPPGVTGRIFVGNDIGFDGYTGGGDKERMGGLLSIGDVGHFDEEGRLFVDGRDDEMIVSGGENVFPREVEDLLAEHPDVAEVAVKGVSDEEFGQRLAAFVVLRPGASLDEGAVRSHVRDHLARYKVPRDVVFLDELPRTESGKVLKRALEPPAPGSEGPAA